MKRPSKTDWKRLETMTEEEIERNALSDLDAQPTDEDFWADAQVIIPPKKVLISIRLDADILEWFKDKDIPYQTLINGVLRNYMEHHKDTAA
jgi:uncharacterized protein (DUF4415 family)